MKDFEYIGATSTTELQENIRIINILYGFVILVLFAIISGYAFGPFAGLLSYLPSYSIIVILTSGVLLTIASVMLSHVFTKKMFQSIEEHNQKLNDIFHVSDQLSGELRREAVVKSILDYCLRMTRSNAGYLLLVENRQLVLRAAKGGGFESLLGRTIALNTGLAGAVLKSGRPALLDETSALPEPAADMPQNTADQTEKAENEMEGDAVISLEQQDAPQPGRTSTLDGMVRYQTLSAVCVPLRSKRGIIGVIELLNTRQGSYNEGDIKLISHLAGQAAASLEMARMYGALRAARK